MSAPSGSDVGVVQRGSGGSFVPETFQRLRIGEKFQRHEPAERRVLGFANHTHPAAEFLDVAIMRYATRCFREHYSSRIDEA
jgi:hypothetical protein